MKKKLSDLLPKDDSAKTGAPKKKTLGLLENVENNQAQIDLNVLRKYNIFFATPCYGGMLTDQYFLSMFRATQSLMKNGINLRLTTLRNESLVTRARNILSACLWKVIKIILFFIDADIEFDAESILRALAFDKDIMAGAYPKKALPIHTRYEL